MGIRQTIRRLASVRDSSNSRRRRRNSDVDAASPITSSLPERTSIVLEEEPIETAPSTETSLRADADGQRSYEIVLGAEITSPSQPQAPTGKRKPSNAARLRQLKLQEQRSDGNPRPRRRARLDKNEEPPPQDYLYFGEGQPSPALSSSSSHTDTPTIQITPATASPGVTGRAVSPYRSSPRTPTTPSSPGLTVPGSGMRHASGFHSTGIVTQNVGYQNLTYGGSLQFDYAQVQAPGTGAGY